jgi:hypothetical protein
MTGYYDTEGTIWNDERTEVTIRVRNINDRDADPMFTVCEDGVWGAWMTFGDFVDYLGGEGIYLNEWLDEERHADSERDYANAAWERQAL